MKLLGLALIVLGFVSTSHALTLKEKKQLADWQTELETGDAATQFKTKCGYAMPVTLDEKFVTPFMETDMTASGSCDQAMGSMATMCEDATSKASINKQVKKLNCKFASKGPAAFKLVGTTLEFTFSSESSNLDSQTKTFLENNLR